MGRRLVLAAGSIAVALFAAEIGLRMTGAFEPPPPVPQSRRPDLYRPDPDLGYTLWPSTVKTYHYPVGSTVELRLVSNSDGFRSDREFDAPDVRRRLWMLGDSMVFGDGVEARDRVTEVMEATLEGWRVDNLGMTGWGLDLMVRAFEKLSERVRPDAVVLGFYTDDFRRLGPFYSGQGYPIPKFALQDGRLVTVPFPAPLAPWRRLRVVQAVEQSYWRANRNRYDVNEALLDRLLLDAGDRTRLIATFLPGRGDTDEDRERRGRLAAWCERTGTPLLDLTDTMVAAGIERTYIAGNPHWNAAGHRVAGEAIGRFLIGLGMAP